MRGRRSMAEQKKPADMQKKRPRISEKAESSSKKSSVLAAVTSPVAMKTPALAAPSPVATKTPALAAPSPVATKTPALAAPSPVATKTPALAAPSPVATKTPALPALAAPSPVARKTPALVAPSPVATKTLALAAPSPVAMVKPTAVVKREQEDGGVLNGGGDEQAGAMAMVAVAEAGERVNLDVEKKWLHCAVCPAPLKPPIFMCEGGHVVCCACGGGRAGAGNDNPNNHCGACNRAATYTRFPYMDGLVDNYKVPCPYKKFGCTRSVTYHETAEHKDACTCAPCYCFECPSPFEGSPAMLLRHLTEAGGRHSWPAETIKYETARPFVVPGPSEHRRLLVAEEDGRVFLLGVGAAGRGVRPVTVVCVRSGNADARPLYKCVLWVDGPPAAAGDVRGCLKLEEKVASCAVPGEVDLEHGRLVAHVNPAMLHGESKEVHLRISIIKFA